MEILGIIPARGGSKGIAGKNLAPVLGKPLIVWTFEAAGNTKNKLRTIVSTDSEEIASVCKKNGVESPVPRPADLAQDHTPIIPVLQHVLAELKKKEGYRPDAVLLLQPTSPLRTAKDIDDAIALFESTGADSLVSVVPVPHRFSPESLMRADGDHLVPYTEGAAATRRQDKPKLFARNGPAIVISKTELIEAGKLYGDACRPFVMGPHTSVDIDDPEDLAYAAFLLGQR